MGEEVLQLLSTRASQGVKTSKDTVLQGIMDSFSGDIALDEKARNKALFDVSKKVFQNLKKLEQQTLSEGKKYQQNFAKQKGGIERRHLQSHRLCRQGQDSRQRYRYRHYQGNAYRRNRH
jgi:pyruvate-formate lyase